MGLDELRGLGRTSGRSLDVLAILRDVASAYSTQITIEFVDEMNRSKADRASRFLGYKIGYSAELPSFLDLGSIIAPFSADAWPSEYSIRRAFGEYLAPVDARYATVLPGTGVGKGKPLIKAAVPPSIVIAWDPGVLSAPEYADLVASIGDVAREAGAAGIERVLTESVGFGQSVGVSK